MVALIGLWLIIISLLIRQLQESDIVSWRALASHIRILVSIHRIHATWSNRSSCAGICIIAWSMHFHGFRWADRICLHTKTIIMLLSLIKTGTTRTLLLLLRHLHYVLEVLDAPLDDQRYILVALAAFLGLLRGSCSIILLIKDLVVWHVSHLQALILVLDVNSLRLWENGELPRWILCVIIVGLSLLRRIMLAASSLCRTLSVVRL